MRLLISQDARDYWRDLWRAIDAGENTTLGELHTRLEEKYGRGAREEIEERVKSYQEAAINEQLEREEAYQNEP